MADDLYAVCDGRKRCLRCPQWLATLEREGGGPPRCLRRWGHHALWSSRPECAARCDSSMDRKHSACGVWPSIPRSSFPSSGVFSHVSFWCNSPWYESKQKCISWFFAANARLSSSRAVLGYCRVNSFDEFGVDKVRVSAPVAPAATASVGCRSCNPALIHLSDLS